MRRFFLLVLFFFSFFKNGSAQNHDLMPVPASIIYNEQPLKLDNQFRIFMNIEPGSRATKAVERFLRRLDNRTHLFISKSIQSEVIANDGSHLTIKYLRKAELKVGEDESYKLIVSGKNATLTATTDLGILHGLETILQLMEHDSSGYFIPGVTIDDKPRFPWRGLLIDVGRHFSPVDVIKRNIDGMAMVKMNVLHLHLSEDQGFRIESKVFPKLHELGSNGEYYTQIQVKEIIDYAAERGIRVVPEFDMPGHATSWMVGHPELASAPGPYVIEKKFGVFDPTMDPTKKSTYKFLEKFIGEMANLFPDEYFHIGGDENEGKQWDKNSEIQEFKKKNNLKNNHELQNYFNLKVQAIVKKNKKKMIGWDEILQPGLPSDVMIQSWRGTQGLKDAATKGHQVILSNGYYIDLSNPAWKHYMNDPLPADLGLTTEQEKFILGGEATMWAELVTPENIDSRIWPRTAAIAERLWSDREVNNIPDMYRRLDAASLELESVGLLHVRNQEMMLRRIVGNYDVHPLQIFVNTVEPLKDYNRGGQGIPYSTDLPLTRLPDIAFPESKTARDFRMLCEQRVRKRDISVAKEIKSYLELWISNHDSLVAVAQHVPALKNWVAMSVTLREISKVGLESLDYMNRPNVVTDEWTSTSHRILTDAKKPIDESEFAVLESITMLFQHALPK